MNKLKKIILAFAAVALVATLATNIAGRANAEVPDSVTAEAQEWQLLTLINTERAANGKQPLRMQLNIRDYARVHAKEMRVSGTIWHDMPAYAEWLPSGWRAYGENVAYNQSIASIHQAFMNSAGHKANILNGEYNYVGLGVAAGSGGRLYVSENFMRHDGVVSVVADPSATTLLGDINGDNRVNALDLSVLLSHDGQNYPAADFNKDGSVGSADTAILLSKWTW